MIADGTATICAGTSVDLTTKIIGYASLLSPVWMVATATGTAVSTPTSVSPSTKTAYVLVAQNTLGCKDTANIVVTVNPIPTNVTASSNSPIAQGGTINLNSTSTDGMAYTWSGSNSYTSTAQNPAIASATKAMAGTYTVTVTSSGACTATATTLVAITVPPTCTPPTIVTTRVTQATCNGAIANNVAKIDFTSTGGDKYGISVGTTYSGTAYSSALVLTTGSGSLIGIANPAIATSYTRRVFNGSDTCFKDITVILNPKTCIVPCEPKCIPFKLVIYKLK